jgi:hypothetical protein
MPESTVYEFSKHIGALCVKRDTDVSKLGPRLGIEPMGPAGHDQRPGGTDEGRDCRAGKGTGLRRVVPDEAGRGGFRRIEVEMPLQAIIREAKR